MEKRQHRVDAFVVAGLNPGFAHAPVRFEVAVGEHHTLGQSGGAGGVLQERYVVSGGPFKVGGDRRALEQMRPACGSGGGSFKFFPGLARLFDRQFERRTGENGHRFNKVHGVNMCRPDVCGHISNMSGNFIPHDSGLRAVVLEHMPQLGAGVKGVVFHDDRAQAQNRVEGNNMLRAVGQNQGDPIPRLHPGQAQPFGSAVDLTAKFGVGGGCTEKFEGDLMGNLADSIVNQVAQRGFGQVNVYGDAG